MMNQMKDRKINGLVILFIWIVSISLMACSAQGEVPSKQEDVRDFTEDTLPEPEVEKPNELPQEEQPNPVELKVETVVTNLKVPWGIDFAPNGDLFVTERPGRIQILTSQGKRIGIPIEGTYETSEGGLLGLALHPQFQSTHWVYVYQTYRSRGGSPQNRILRFQYDGESGSLMNREVVFDGIPAAAIHDGGQLAFGPDGKLYVSVGDANRAEDAQDTSKLNGKILRLNVDGSVPVDNPLGPNHPVYSYGHRNPEGLAFHPVTGELYSVEHGSDKYDEVNRIVPGKNYGWPIVRGSEHGSYIAPLRVYDPIIAPAGAAFYQGPITQWQGDFFFGTLGFDDQHARHLHRIRLAEDGETLLEEETLYRNEFGRIRAVKMGPDGCLYFGTSNRDGRGAPSSEDDRILRVCKS